jgi:hypothetical protein
MAWFGEKILDFMVWMGKKNTRFENLLLTSMGGEKRGR